MISIVMSKSSWPGMNLAAEKLPLPPAAEDAWWYQYYFATERGVRGLKKYRGELGKFVWRFNSPTWHFSDETYERTAAAFNNPAFPTANQNTITSRPSYRNLRASWCPRLPLTASAIPLLFPVMVRPTMTSCGSDGVADQAVRPDAGA